MPRFTFRTPPVAEVARRQAAEVAAQRFPEVDVVDCRMDGDRPNLQIWECRAPNAAHLRRWAAAAHLTADDVRMVPRSDSQ